MDCIMISAQKTDGPAAVDFPVVCLFLIPRHKTTDAQYQGIWRQLRDLVNAGCGGEVAYQSLLGGSLIYPNNYTPMLTTLIREPAFFDLLEEHDLDGHALELYFYHSAQCCAVPRRPALVALAEEEQTLPAFNQALRHMRRFSDARRPISVTEPNNRLLCIGMPPMKWFVLPVPKLLPGARHEIAGQVKD